MTISAASAVLLSQQTIAWGSIHAINSNIADGLTVDAFVCGDDNMVIHKGSVTSPLSLVGLFGARESEARSGLTMMG